MYMGFLVELKFNKAELRHLEHTNLGQHFCIIGYGVGHSFSPTPTVFNGLRTHIGGET